MATAVSYVTEHGIRWTAKPQNLVPAGRLEDHVTRTLDQVSSAWRNAHRVESDHALEVAQLCKEAMK